MGPIVRALVDCWPDAHRRGAIVVVDDGSRDDTVRAARDAGALVVCHGSNRGKGAALRTGLRVAHRLGFRAAVTLDADGQHAPEDAARLAGMTVDGRALVLGVRDLAAEGAPWANRFSNGISNVFLSAFTARALADTQCGLRRYPVDATLALEGRANGYAYEAEVLLLAARAGLPIVQVPVRALYGGAERFTHFDPVRDPARIVARVLLTLARPRPVAAYAT
ncbi:MAG: glycosyltransferase family 2 protein [Polyangiaceae bacterium]|nr:glycosyltransferase family 2 protein [Polyangiaceae bacterium]